MYSILIKDVQLNSIIQDMLIRYLSTFLNKRLNYNPSNAEADDF